MTTRAAVVAEARSWIGTPWEHQHRAKGIAVDCVGLVVGVARVLGVVPPCFDVRGYARLPDGTLIERCAKVMAPVTQIDMRPGDVVVVAIEHEPAHMGIVGDYRHGGLSMIHADNRRGVVEHRMMFAHNLRFRAAFALPGVA